MTNVIHRMPKDMVPAGVTKAMQSLSHQWQVSKPGQLITKENVIAFSKNLQDRLQEVGGRPFFRALVARAEALARISPEDWNDAQERIFVDLHAIYASLAQFKAQDATKGELTRDAFLQTRAQILDAVNQVRLYQFLKSNQQFQDAKFVDFVTTRNESDLSPRARVDPDVRLLELSPRARQNLAQRAVDLTSAIVTTEFLGGGRLGGMNDEFEPTKMLDDNPESFWAEMIMAESPISVTYTPSADAGLGSEIDSKGIVAHVYVELSKVAQVNTIQILPFGEYPVRVIDLAYKESGGQTTWMKVPEFQVENATLDWIEVNFDPRTIAILRITLEQVNYRSNLYHLPEKEVRNGLIWQHIGRSRKSEKLRELQTLTENEEDLIRADPDQLIRLQAEEDFRMIMEGESLQKGREQEFKVMRKTLEKAGEAIAKPKPETMNPVTQLTSGEQIDAKGKTVTIRTYEYVVGIRDVRLQHNVYQPIGHFASPKYVSGATILSAGINVEERHPTFTDGLGEFYRTSTEWSLEIGRDRRYPLAPKNWRDDSGLIQVPDEFLQFERLSQQAVTRLPVASLAGTLRKNGVPVPQSAYTVLYYGPGGTVQGPYTGPGDAIQPGLRNTNGFTKSWTPPAITQRRGLVEITDDGWFDPNAVYTFQYVADDAADALDIDEELQSVELEEPEIFEQSNRNNQIALSYFPYVDYGIINSDRWVQDGDNPFWTFAPQISNFRTGTVSVTNGSPNVTLTGSTWTAMKTALDSGVRMGFRVNDDGNLYEVLSMTASTLVLKENYEGTTGSGFAFGLGELFESDAKIYCLDRITYTPVRVYVNDVLAKNFTDYTSGEHQAFNEIAAQGRQVQYIQAGNILYFNRPVQGKIEAHYSWLTQYVRVLATLRCNIPVRTVLTPQVNSFRVELETSKL